MKQFKRNVLTAVIAGLLLGGGFAYAESGLFGIKSDTRAKIAKEKAKRNSLSDSNNTSDGDSDRGECGSQQVGNVATGGSNRPPREVTTIVTGDVINIVDRGCK